MYRIPIVMAAWAVMAVALPNGAAAQTTSSAEATTLTLPMAVERTLGRSPDLRAARAQLGVFAGMATQAGLALNPRLALEAEEFLGSGALSGFDAAEFNVRLEQEIQLANKRGKARHAAEREANVAEIRFRAKQAATLAELTRAFVAALAAQELASLRERLVRIATENVTTVADRLRAGVANEAELAKARIAESEARLAHMRAKQARHIAFRHLSQFWGEPVPTFTQVAGPLFRFSPAPDLESLIRLADQAPSIVAARAGIDVAMAERDLAEARKVPNLTIGAGAKVRNGPGDVGAIAGISMPIPVFDRNQGGRAAAVASVSASRAESRSMETQLRTRLSEQRYNLVAAVEALTEMRDVMLPQARMAYETSQALFRRGRFSYLDLLDAQRTLFAQEQRQLETLAAYHATIAAIEGLLGASIGELPTSDQPKDDLK